MVKENKELKENKKECCFGSKLKSLCSNKKTWIIAGAVVLVVLIVLGIIIFTNRSNEKELKANMKKLGGQFYEEFYYPAQEKAQKDVKEFMNKFENTGIKVNLTNIAKVSKVDQDLVKDMVNSKTKKECDKEETYVVIKPKKPFGKKDYTVEVFLSCGFGDKKETTKKSSDTKKETTKKETTTNKTSEKTSTKETKKTK